MSIFYFFTTKNFHFRTAKLYELFDELSLDDRLKYNFNSRAINWTDYHYNGVKQIRRIVLKEDDSTIPKARQKVTMLYYADLSLKYFALLALSFYLVRFGLNFANTF